MNDDPLKVLTTVPRIAFPILDALHRLHRDVGSIKARLVLPHLDPRDEARLICVGCVDEADVLKLSRDLAAELGDDHESASLASRVAIISAGLDLRVVAFLMLPCVRANEGE
jgi:hypothetical protein